MKRVFFKGDIKDVCEELKREAERCKGKTVGEWLQQRKREKSVADFLGMTFSDYLKVFE